MLNRNVALDAGYRWMTFNAGDVAGCPGCRFEWNGVTAGVRYNWASDNAAPSPTPPSPTGWRVVPRINMYFASAWGRTAGGVQFATWHNNLSGFDVRAMAPASRWGVEAEYYSSPQHSMIRGGSILDRGSDNFWSINGKYALAPWAHVSAGYGYYNWDTTFLGGSREALSSSGVFAGAHVGWRITPNVRISGDARFFPSNSTRLTSGGVETRSSGSAFDGNIHLTYRPAGGNLDFQAGYRWVNLNAGDVAACPGCQFGWGGFTGSIRFRF
jgi:opacity protein-like surface antigen